MIYIKIDNNTKNNMGFCNVNYIHYLPFDIKNGLNKTETELLKDGFLVDGIPDKLDETHDYELCYNPDNGKLKYIDLGEKTTHNQLQKTQIELMQEQIDNLNLALAELMGV